MMLVDKEIKERIEKENLIVNADLDNLSSISCDVTIDSIVIESDKEVGEFVLSRWEYVYVRTKESLNMPNDLCCNVAEKNSLMRKGICVDGPLYQPGHSTDIFLRIVNIGKSDFLLKKGIKIAQLTFFKLSDIPNVTYDKQPFSQYVDERKFIK